jgi:hypothetical protein
MPQTGAIRAWLNSQGEIMNMHARTIEPDFGSLLDTDDDVLEVADRRGGKMEPRLDAGPRPKAGLTLGPDDRIDAGSPGRALPVLSRQQAEDQPAATLIGVWGGFWRAVVIGAVAGVVGGIVGAFTLVWLTGAGWAVFAKLLIDAVGRL